MLMPLPLSSCSNNPAESLARTLSVNKYFPSAIPMCSLKSQEAVPLLHEIFLSVAPFNVMPPPFAVSFVGELTEPSSIFLSSTLTVVELIVETVPFTVKFPATERSSDKETCEFIVRDVPFVDNFGPPAYPILTPEGSNNVSSASTEIS